jgi:hypothetical protein
MENLSILKKGEIGRGLLIENDGWISMDATPHNKQLKEAAHVSGTDEWFVPKPFIVDAVLQKYGIKNANGRIYPEDVLKPAVEKYQTLINDKMAIAELNHPMESSIDLGRISHNIIECHWEGHTLVGKLELNVTEGFRRFGICSSRGDDAAQLLLNGWKIGISSRSVGDTQQRLGQTYVTNLELIGFDIVATPSTPNAYLSMNGPESLQAYVEGEEPKKVIDEKIDRIAEILNS